jgi:hypothetical protein
VAWTAGVTTVGLVGALRSLRAGEGFDLLTPVRGILVPADLASWTTAVGVVVFSLLAGLATGALLVARRATRDDASG